MRLHLDLETFSPVSIADCGNYKYAADPDFEILLLAYAFDDDPVSIVDLASGESIPSKVLNALIDPNITKVAHNAVFERVCLTYYLRKRGFIGETRWLSAESWDCTMVRCYRAGLPGSLAEAGKVLGFEEQKMAEGRLLIKKFCTPLKTEGMFAAKHLMPADAPKDWQTFKDYCVRDVEVERNIDKALAWVLETPAERELYICDQIINDRGVLIDMDLVRHAERIDSMMKAGLVKQARELTGLDNPNSVGQLRIWLEQRLGQSFDSLRKTDIEDIAKMTDDPIVHQVLSIRKQSGKTSNAKYGAMLDAAGKDDRARGLLQFYGTRTGRWAGRLVQLQNLPQNHLPIEELTFARQLVAENDLDSLKLCFGDVSDTLSQLIRTAFVAPEGKTLAVCDFSAIEARVLAWLAGEEWVLDTFRQGGDIYCATASQMFHVPVEKHGANAELRQKGKIAVLALGYGGGVNALDKMGGQRLGMTESEEQDTVDKWRSANKRIVAFWAAVERAAIDAITHPTKVTSAGPLNFGMHEGYLLVSLPSLREIAYPCAEVCPGKYGGVGIRYKGVDQATNKWVWLDTFGGKLVENITQAVARDCLANVITTVERNCRFVDIVFHVHDEIVTEVPEDKATEALDEIKEVFSRVPSWAEGLPLKGAGYITKFYLKD